ncbi:MAG: DUF447 domain-containing protein [Planctomycetota bacterium]|jgi:hypothetical protein
MILEGVVTSQNARGELNVAPMGPIVEPDMQRFVLRPFQTSTTYRNLKQHPFGVLHVVDDVLLLARTAIGRLAETPRTFSALRIPGRVLSNACRWYEFRVNAIDDSEQRTRIEASVEHVGRLRDCFGFNRAKHAVIEAAILATRIHLLPVDEIRDQFERLRSPVEKTAGPDEQTAFRLLDDFVREQLAAKPQAAEGNA